MSSRTHTQAHTPIHSHSHTPIHAHTRTHTHARTLTQASCKNIHTYIRENADTRIYACFHTNTCTHMRLKTFSPAHTLTHCHRVTVQTIGLKHILMNSFRHSQNIINTLTHTHTYSHPLSLTHSLSFSNYLIHQQEHIFRSIRLTHTVPQKSILSQRFEKKLPASWKQRL